MKKIISYLLIFICFSCQKQGPILVEKTYDSFFVPYRTLNGKLDPGLILPQFNWQVEIDNQAKMDYRYENIDSDPEDEMILVYIPSNNTDVHAFLFLDKQNGTWKTGGFIAQGGAEYYSSSEIPDYSPSGKIFWLNEFMNGDCMGGNYLHGYKFINGKIEPVVSIPGYHDGCCDGENCYVLKREGLIVKDSRITYSVLFTRSRYTNEGSAKDNNFQKEISFSLYFDEKTYSYRPVDGSENDLIEKTISGESAYPYTDVYSMKDYISKKYTIPSL